MLFQSFPFVFIFLPAVLAAYWLTPSKTWRLLLLTGASYFFYGWWDYRFCGLLLLSTLIDYVAGGRIAASGSQRARKTWLALAVTSNLSLLGFFKYWDFLAGSANWGLTRVLGEGPLPLYGIALPIGISFYTFQTMSYSIDIYRGQARPAGSLLKFMAFVSMFPQLVMGPIVRWTEVDGQLEALRRWPDRGEAAAGLNIFIVGLAKKLLVADLMFPLVDPRNFGGMSWLEFWPSFLGWSYWLYYDFSSYSDMAVGLGLLLGLRFPPNFNSPYQAESPSDYWGRWNMTLGRWMRDYLFFPLGGSRKGLTRTLANLLIVYFLIGLWHGASWVMVLWGVYQGLAVAGHVLARRYGWRIRSRVVKRMLVFLLITGGGFFFRATDLADSGGFLAAALGGNGWGMPNPVMLVVFIVMTIHVQFSPSLWQWKWRHTWWESAALAILFLAAVSRMFNETPFFYFQF